METVHEVEIRGPVSSPAQTGTQQLAKTGKASLNQSVHPAGAFKLQFSHKCLGDALLWNQLFSQVLFTPATQAARQAACTIVEALTTIPSRKQQVLDLLTR